MATVVKCPTCGRDVEWTEASRYRPFCSERCKLIDLGAWAAEKYAIPGRRDEQADETPPSETPPKH
ncbi:MAG: DNA gyrase inhibitor YacG [Burkholderiaceae bacterium]